VSHYNGKITHLKTNILGHVKPEAGSAMRITEEEKTTMKMNMSEENAIDLSCFLLCRHKTSAEVLDEEDSALCLICLRINCY
jgi:hypothetical protein